jgi:hypothetical protein
MDERSKDALTTPWLDAEQAGRLGDRELESRHFAELRPNPRAQIMFLAGFDATGLLGLCRGLRHQTDSW